MLEAISSLSARPFASREEATVAILDLMHRTLGLPTPFVSRTEHAPAR
jgi:hypothetical protein